MPDTAERLIVVEGNVAQLRSDHATLAVRFEADHKLLAANQIADAEVRPTLQRIEEKVNAILGIEPRVRAVEEQVAERRGRWWTVAKFAAFVVAVATGAAVTMISQWIRR